VAAGLGGLPGEDLASQFVDAGGLAQGHGLLGGVRLRVVRVLDRLVQVAGVEELQGPGVDAAGGRRRMALGSGWRGWLASPTGGWKEGNTRPLVSL